MMTLKRKVSILGSTGSVGSNTLNVIRDHKEQFEVVSLSCGSSIPLLIEQISEFCPRFVSVATEALATELKKQLPAGSKIEVFSGNEGHCELVRAAAPDVLMSSMNGTHGLLATLEAINQSAAVVGIANKEILVMAGPFILEALGKSKTKLVPVDSEHSAIFQALMGNSISAVDSLILTASGGPFRERAIETFENITRAEALKHPNWVMGSKITIDSATMMNKGLEFIEAIRLFNIPAEKVRIIVHPESTVHSLVEYCDGSLMAQLGISDMRIPISLALSYPNRIPLDLGKKLDLVEQGKLHFEAPDYQKFPCLKLAIESEAMGSAGPVILNAANEVAVERFLTDKIGFMDIPRIIEKALCQFSYAKLTSLDEAIALDKQVKLWSFDKNPRNSKTPSRPKPSHHETISP